MTGRPRSLFAVGSATADARVNVSQVFAGQLVGIRQMGERIWLVTFVDYDLRYLMTGRAGSNRSKTPSARKYYPCFQNEV